MSPMALIAESGYRANRNAIDVERIKKHVVDHPELIGAWMGYSEDKRTTGWYFSAVPGGGMFVVGGSRSSEKKYSDRFEACAIYIQHELDHLASQEVLAEAASQAQSPNP
jgi:hypothetical protein